MIGNVIGMFVAILALVAMLVFIVVLFECMYDMTKAVQDYFRTMKWLDRLNEMDEGKERLSKGDEDDKRAGRHGRMPS